MDAFRESLLGWYDKHRRVLPWRALPGETADPYRVWLSEIMLQQTTVGAVIAYFLKFIERWPDVHALAAAPTDDVMQAWAGLGYYARARNLHKCAKVVSGERGGVFPDIIEDLKTLPGIGDYTSAAIAAIAFNKPATVVDGNVERVMARIFAVTEPLPDCKPTLKALARILCENRSDRPGDFAQALMDLGATVCIPSSPRCMICPVSDFCEARKLGIAPGLPARRAKGLKPQKQGHYYVIYNADRSALLFERRGEKGMLGGTIGLPTSSWEEKGQKPAAHPVFLKNLVLSPIRDSLVRHSFTHFDLDIIGQEGQWTGRKTQPPAPLFWVPLPEIQALGVPSLFKKALRLLHKTFELHVIK